MSAFLVDRVAISPDFHGSFLGLKPILCIYEFLAKLLSSVNIQHFYGKTAEIELHAICVISHMFEWR